MRREGRGGAGALERLGQHLDLPFERGDLRFQGDEPGFVLVGTAPNAARDGGSRRRNEERHDKDRAADDRQQESQQGGYAHNVRSFRPSLR